MQRKLVLCFIFLTMLSAIGYVTLALVSRATGSSFVASAGGRLTQGALQIVDSGKGIIGECPLKHTDVKVEISGFISRAVVTQEFANPFREKIEAVYTFPLPQSAAVDDLTLVVGDRTVRGLIKRREEARALYEAARKAGHVTSLLDQERPNIFTQSVANILPGEKVVVTISYVETLKYEDGSYEFVFPMVVGPRYIPGTATGKQGGGFAPDTDRVPDASRITPSVAQQGTRAGHDISIEVALDAGVPIDGLKSTLHEVDLEQPTNHSAVVRLKSKTEIPNKDFILRYDAAGRQIEDAVLTHRSDSEDGFFTMILQPPERVTVQDVMPKELVFVLDTSGSMSGFPIEKAKETMKLALDGLYPQDTFNLITFSGDEHILFPQPVPATRENLAKAQAFLASRSGSGGTEMMKAIRAALDPSDAQDHIRIACFMTDGYVGNDMEIISEIQKHPNARVFAFGIGSSVNRFLLDKMAEHGRGDVEYVTLSDDGSAAAKRFHERIRNPLLSDISIDWSGLNVADIYPKRIPDLFSSKPVILSGRYTAGGRGVIKLKGKMSGRDFVREIPIELPFRESRHDVVATLWARTRIDDLMSQDYNGIQNGNVREDIREAITQLGLNFRLMTQFTSFVAVEEMTVTDGGTPRKIDVPVEMPEGVSHEGVFGTKDQPFEKLQTLSNLQQPRLAVAETVIVTTRPSAPPPPTSSPAAAPRKTKAGKEQVVRSGSGSGVATGSGGGMGPGDGKGVGAGRGSNQGGESPRLGGGSGAGSANPTPRAELTLAESVGLAERRPSPEEQKRQDILAKMSPSIAAVIQRLKNNTAQPAADEVKFVRNGKAELQIWLTEKSPEVLAQLEQLGFEVVLDPKTAKMIIGRLAIGKLAELAELKAVRYIAPLTNK